jgi:hypothetical protein
LKSAGRYYWLAKQEWRPFVALSLGATHTDQARAELVVTNTAIDLKNVAFANAGTKFSQTFETGVEFAPSDRLQLRFSVRANHVGHPSSSHDPQLAKLGFNTGDDADSRVTYPVSLAGVFRF